MTTAAQESYVVAITKDPDAILDYGLDWSSWLGTDTISTSVWTSDGLTLTSPSHTTTVTVTWAAGGSVGSEYRLTNRVVTAGGRTDDRTIKLICTDR